MLFPYISQRCLQRKPHGIDRNLCIDYSVAITCEIVMIASFAEANENGTVLVIRFP